MTREGRSAGVSAGRRCRAFGGQNEREGHPVVRSAFGRSLTFLTRFGEEARSIRRADKQAAAPRISHMFDRWKTVRYNGCQPVEGAQADPFEMTLDLRRTNRNHAVDAP